MTAGRALLLALVLGAAPARAQADARLVGTWALVHLSVRGETAPPDGLGTLTMTFGADGSLAAMHTPASGDPERVAGSYRVEADRIRVLADGDETVLRFRFEGDALVLSEEASGEVATLRRTR